MLTGNHEVERSNICIWNEDLLPLLKTRNPQKIKHSDINWVGSVGVHTSLEEKIISRKEGPYHSERYINCDISVPGIVVACPGPDEKYRLVDGGHRMAKMISLGISESEYYVIEKDEYESLFKTWEGTPLSEAEIKSEFPSLFDHVSGIYTPLNQPDRCVYRRDLIPILRGRHVVEIDLNKIVCRDVIDSNEARYIANTINDNMTGIVIKSEDGYELVDDEHLIFKLKFFGKTKHTFTVITDEEIKPHYRCIESGLLLSENRIELKKIHNVFGFDIPVFRYLNHEKFKSDLYYQFNQYSLAGETYTRTDRRKNIFDIESESVLDLKNATMSAYDCFYKHIHGINFSDTIEITQSWMVDLPAVPHQNPMSVHGHFMSLACSTYYMKHEQGVGGDLRFENPIVDFMDNVIEFKLLNKMRWTKGRNMFFDLPVEESDIVVFPGGFKHTISPYMNTKENRISIPSNSLLTPLRSRSGEELEPHYGYRFDIGGHHEL